MQRNSISNCHFIATSLRKQNQYNMKSIATTMLVQLFGSILLFTSCHRDTIRNNVKASEYFPNTIGNYWEYDVYDSSVYREHHYVPRNYTVKVNIISTKFLIDNRKAIVWNYQYPWGNEIKYYRNDNDSVKVFDTSYSRAIINLSYPREIYIIPFAYDKDWSGKLLWIDSFYVRKDNSPGFENSFLIKRKYIGPQTYYYNDYWFTPNIGFEKIHFDEIIQGIRRNEIWTLKKYSLK